ncbi:MAG: hypothetical protein ACPGVT_12020 [Maricaulaceae bacterium]
MSDFENKSGRAMPVKVTMPSGRKVRIEIPEGKFDLPRAYEQALMATPQGKAALGKMRVKKGPKKTGKKSSGKDTAKDILKDAGAKVDEATPKIDAS